MSQNVVLSNNNEPKCPVCLQKFSKNISYTSICLHPFCFECILQWSKVKHNCPLCKTQFDRILFSIKNNISNFSEYQLEYDHEQNKKKMTEPLEIIDNPIDDNKIVYSRASYIVGQEPAPIEFRMLVYLNEWYSKSKQTQSYSDLKYLSTRIEFKKEPDPDSESEQIDIILEPPNNTHKYINYRQVKNFRDITSKWYKNNPACTHRLMLFLHRELKAIACVLKKQESKQPAYLDQQMRSQLLSSIIRRIKECDIKSDKFFETIKMFISPLKLAEHFHHELISFASSISASLADYDSKSVYYTDLTENNSDSILPKILPVNLNKYRLHYKITEEPKIDEEPIILIEDDISNTPEYLYTNNNLYNNSDSSFIEEVEVAQRPSPHYILLSDSSSTSRSRSRSIDRSRSKKKKIISSSRDNKDKKKKKKKLKKRKSSMDRDRSKSPKSKKQHKSRSPRKSSRPSQNLSDSELIDNIESKNCYKPKKSKHSKKKSKKKRHSLRSD